jgi:hypothetical protein
VKVDPEARRHTRRRISLAEAIDVAGGGEHGRGLVDRLAGQRSPGAGMAEQGPLRLITVTEEAGKSLGEGRWVNLIHETLIRSKGVDAAGKPQPYWPTLWSYIEKNLTTRRSKALLFVWLGLGIGSIALSVISIGVIYNVINAIQQPVTPAWINNLFGIPFLACIVLLFISRRHLRTLRREPPSTFVFGHLSMSIYGFICLLIGSYTFFVAIFLGAALAGNILNAYMAILEHADPYSVHFRQSISEMGFGIDTIAYIISVPVVLMFGVRLLRYGLLQTPLIVRPQPTEVSPRTFAFTDLGLIAPPIVLLAAVLFGGTELVKIGCAYHIEGPLPEWVPTNWFNFLDYDCQRYYQTGYPRSELFYTLAFVAALVAEATLLFCSFALRVRMKNYAVRSSRSVKPCEGPGELRRGLGTKSVPGNSTGWGGRSTKRLEDG